MEQMMKTIDVVTLFLIAVGALNWGLMGIFSFDLFATVFGPMTVLTRIVYTLIGFAGVYQLGQFKIRHSPWEHVEAH